jgi:hypothetical protein
MVFLRRLLYYINPLNLFHRQEGEGINLRVMHGINKISFLLFLICLVVLIFKWIR